MKTSTKLALATACLFSAGVASADSHAEKKKAPDVKAPAKVDAKAATPAKAAKPEAPKPAPEIAAMAKQLNGTWKCKGDSFNPDGSKTAITATSKAKLDVDKFWIAENLEVRGPMPFKMTAYTTFDAVAKKWRRVAVTSGGSYMVGTSDGLKDNKMDWTLDTVGPMSSQFREHIDMSDAKAGGKFWGEASMDKGKTWVKVYEMTCKK
jgi:hypothetical protein